MFVLNIAYVLKWKLNCNIFKQKQMQYIEKILSCLLALG